MNWFEWTNVAAAAALSTGINGLWLGMLLAVLATAAIRLLPRPNATTRYAIWLTALLLAMAAPVLLLLPRPIPMAASATAPASAPWTVPVTAQWPVYAALVWLAITLDSAGARGLELRAYSWPEAPRHAARPARTY